MKNVEFDYDCKILSYLVLLYPNYITVQIEKSLLNIVSTISMKNKGTTTVV